MDKAKDEPVIIAASLQSAAIGLISAIIAMLGAFGIIHWNEIQVGTVIGVSSAAIAFISAIWVRRRTTSLANPKDAEGTPLEPVKKVTRGID